MVKENRDTSDYFICGEPYEKHRLIPDCLSAGLIIEIDNEKDKYYQTGVYGYWDGFDAETGNVKDVALHLHEDEPNTIVTTFNSTREAYHFYKKWVVEKKMVSIDSVHGYAVEQMIIPDKENLFHRMFKWFAG